MLRMFPEINETLQDLLLISIAIAHSQETWKPCILGNTLPRIYMACKHAGRVSKPFALPLLAVEQHQVAIVCVFFGRPKWTHFSQTHLIFCPQDPQLTAIELPKKKVFRIQDGFFFLLMGTGYLPMFQRVHVSRSYKLHWEGLDSHDNDRMVINCQNPLFQTPVPQTCIVVMGFCQRLKLNNTSSGATSSLHVWCSASWTFKRPRR